MQAREDLNKRVAPRNCYSPVNVVHGGDRFVSVDPASLFERDSYRLMISAFVPRVRRQPGYGGNRREMNQASGDYAASVSEFEEAGLTRAPAEAVQVLESGSRP